LLPDDQSRSGSSFGSSDSQGGLVSQEDRNGNVQRLTYGGTQLLKVEDGAGQWLAISYDRWGRVAKVADSAGREVAYDYNLDDELVKVTRSGEEVASYTCAPGHLLTSWADPRLPSGSKRGKLAYT